MGARLLLLGGTTRGHALQISEVRGARCHLLTDRRPCPPHHHSPPTGCTPFSPRRRARAGGRVDAAAEGMARAPVGIGGSFPCSVGVSAAARGVKRTTQGTRTQGSPPPSLVPPAHDTQARMGPCTWLGWRRRARRWRSSR